MLRFCIWVVLLIVCKICKVIGCIMSLDLIGVGVLNCLYMEILWFCCLSRIVVVSLFILVLVIVIFMKFLFD